MPQQYKIDKVAEIESRIAENAGLFVVNYNGLTVKQAQELRHQLRECGAEMKVYKNNLVKIALMMLRLSPSCPPRISFSARSPASSPVSLATSLSASTAFPLVSLVRSSRSPSRRQPSCCFHPRRQRRTPGAFAPCFN